MAPLALAATVISAAEQYQSGRAAAAQGVSEQNMANYNAAVNEQEAVAIKQKSAFDQMRQNKEAERIKSSMLARLGSSGADITAGAPLSLQSEQAKELELENTLIGYEGQIGADRAKSQATLNRMSGDTAYQRGKNLQTASNIQAGSTILQGLGEYGLRSYKPKTTYSGTPNATFNNMSRSPLSFSPYTR